MLDLDHELAELRRAALTTAQHSARSQRDTAHAECELAKARVTEGTAADVEASLLRVELATCRGRVRAVETELAAAVAELDAKQGLAARVVELEHRLITTQGADPLHRPPPTPHRQHHHPQQHPPTTPTDVHRGPPGNVDPMLARWAEDAVAMNEGLMRELRAAAEEIARLQQRCDAEAEARAALEDSVRALSGRSQPSPRGAAAGEVRNPAAVEALRQAIARMDRALHT